MSTAALYLITLLLLVVSFRKSRQKTRQALKKAWKSFEGILPQFLSILVLIGIILAVLDRETISRLLGAESGAAGMAVAGVNPERDLVEVVELKNHPWFVGVQYHPEYKSTVLSPSPLFVAFVKAALEYAAKK